MRFLSAVTAGLLLAVTEFTTANEIVVDRLVSRSVKLDKRDSGHRKGHGDKGNYNISFYHINDVHAYVFVTVEAQVPGWTNADDNGIIDIWMSSGAVELLARMSPKVCGWDLETKLWIGKLMMLLYRMCWRIFEGQDGD